MPAAAARQRAVLQTGAPGPPSVMAVLVFASLAALLLFKGYDSFVAPHAAIARAGRLANGTSPFDSPSHLTLKSLPGIGPRDTPEWRSLQQQLVKEVAKGDAGKGFEYLFYGDSITERWRGTEMGKPCSNKDKECPECAKSFKKRFGSFRTALLAISGDQTGHLLWRLDNGEVPAPQHQPKAAILLIGTNDLGAFARVNKDPTDAAPDAVRRLTAIVGLLRNRLPSTHVLLAAVLPRGARASDKYAWPNKYSKGIDFINDHMETAAAGEGNVTYVSCNEGFITNGHIDGALMPDALHPNAAGMDVLARCYIDALHRLGLMTRRKPEPWQRLRRRQRRL